MTRPSPADGLPEPLAHTRRRIRSTTWLAAGAATAASALFGVLFAQPDPTPAAAEPAVSSVPLPSFAPADPSTLASTAATAPHPSTARHHHAHSTTSVAPKPLQPPTQPPRQTTKPGRATSGAS